jgi:hypothetical protein
MNYHELILNSITKHPSNVYGLKWVPSVEPIYQDTTDWPVTRGMAGANESGRHFSVLNHEALTYAYNKLKSPPKLIVEIGVDRSENYSLSSTSTLLKLKPTDCVYIGIDIEDKSSLQNPSENIFTIQTDSADKNKIYEYINALGLNEIDFMFVDGWHSINQVLFEWTYWERMSAQGVMAFHDTNCHFGPVAVLDAIDTDLFSVEYFGRGEVDWGVGVVQRL